MALVVVVVIVMVVIAVLVSRGCEGRNDGGNDECAERSAVFFPLVVMVVVSNKGGLKKKPYKTCSCLFLF